ncbi:hypothetical protein GmHk_14G041244 [Glycine max]|nr:hypothetical protein GmHk_14G041244 [Glycine max]
MSVLELYVEKDVAGGSMFHAANSVMSCGHNVSHHESELPRNISNLHVDEDDDDDDDYLASNSYVEESLNEDDSDDGISDTDDEVTGIVEPVSIVHPSEGVPEIQNPFWTDAMHYNNINWSHPDEEDICGLVMPTTFNVGQELYVGMDFDSKDEVKKALKQYVMKEAFKYCKPIIQVDGTHLYGKYRGTLLMATSQDGNGGVLPLAFVVVEGETLTAWSWFLAHLHEHVTDKNEICLISDRHASIKSAIANEALGWQPPHGYHVYCIRHIASNFNRKFNNAKQKEMFKKLACGYVSMNYYQYIDVVYTNEHILKACSAQWWPLGNEAAIPPSDEAWTLIPDPTTICAKGQPKSTRIRNEMDWVEPSDHRQKCSRCGAEGHNRRRCPMQSDRGSNSFN